MMSNHAQPTLFLRSPLRCWHIGAWQCHAWSPVARGPVPRRIPAFLQSESPAQALLRASKWPSRSIYQHLSIAIIIHHYSIYIYISNIYIYLFIYSSLEFYITYDITICKTFIDHYLSIGNYLGIYLLGIIWVCLNMGYTPKWPSISKYWWEQDDWPVDWGLTQIFDGPIYNIRQHQHKCTSQVCQAVPPWTAHSHPAVPLRRNSWGVGANGCEWWVATSVSPSKVARTLRTQSTWGQGFR